MTLWPIFRRWWFESFWVKSQPPNTLREVRTTRKFYNCNLNIVIFQKVVTKYYLTSYFNSCRSDLELFDHNLLNILLERFIKPTTVTVTTSPGLILQVGAGIIPLKVRRKRLSHSIVTLVTSATRLMVKVPPDETNCWGCVKVLPPVVTKTTVVRRLSGNYKSFSIMRSNNTE